MSTNGKTLNFRAAKIKGFTVILITRQEPTNALSEFQLD